MYFALTRFRIPALVGFAMRIDLGTRGGDVLIFSEKSDIIDISILSVFIDNIKGITLPGNYVEICRTEAVSLGADE